MGVREDIWNGICRGVREGIEAADITFYSTPDTIAEQSVEETIIPNLAGPDTVDEHLLECRDTDYEEVLDELETKYGNVRVREYHTSESTTRNSMMESYRDGADYLAERLPDDHVQAVKAVDAVENGDRATIMYYMLSGEERPDTETEIFP